ncbi:MAG: N-6 DNA methylase, partial [Bacteroidales bacterium]|nr:N-6 DNA methylase [Bacteroidales bacterium]
MPFNKRLHLQANIDAIRTIFILEKEHRQPTSSEIIALKQYSGFGGIKCILNPAQTEADKAYWTKSEVDLFPMVSDLHKLIRENSKDEQEYKSYFDSLKSSVLTAFYTPPEIIKALSDVLKESGVVSARFLEPSAGNGAFIDAFKSTFRNMETVCCFEKDLLTGKILSHLYPGDKVHIAGYEEIENRLDNKYDVIASNIPFGDTAVFDISFSKSNDIIKRQATRTVHNYFFLKSVEMLREGGLLAFITSQGVMNSQSNEPVREWLMKNTNLVSAVRLPNNLMSDNAGTEVGSDLIILQKNSYKTQLSNSEKQFIETTQTKAGIGINKYIYNRANLIFTAAKTGVDMYGKPGIILTHSGGAAGIARELQKRLNDDFSKRLDIGLYRQQAVPAQPEQVKSSAPLPTLYDLFGITEQKQKINQSQEQQEKQQEQGQLAIMSEIMQIKQRAIYDSTFMMAPNGQPSKLTEQEWLQVRTNSFKSSFGDWELANKLQLIEGLAATGIVQHSLTDEQLLETYKKIGEAQNKNDNRNVAFVNTAFDKIIRHRGVDTKKIIPQLKEVFENAVPVYSESEIVKEGHKEHNNFTGYHNYLGKVRIDGKEYYVRFTAQELTPSKKRDEKVGKLQLHNTAISDVRIYEKSDLPVTTEDYSIGNDNKAAFMDAKLQHFFELAREIQKKLPNVIDENGEPHVVWHNATEFSLPVSPRPFAGTLERFYKEGFLVIDAGGQVGFLKERYRNDAVFKSLELDPLQTQK